MDPEVLLAVATFVVADGLSALGRQCSRRAWLLAALLATGTFTADFYSRGGADHDPFALVGLWVLICPMVGGLWVANRVRRRAAATAPLVRAASMAAAIGAVVVLWMVAPAGAFLRWPRIVLMILVLIYESTLTAWSWSRKSVAGPRLSDAFRPVRADLIQLMSWPMGHYFVVSLRQGSTRAVGVYRALISAVRTVRRARLSIRPVDYRRSPEFHTRAWSKRE